MIKSNKMENNNHFGEHCCSLILYVIWNSNIFGNINILAFNFFCFCFLILFVSYFYTVSTNFLAFVWIIYSSSVNWGPFFYCNSHYKISFNNRAQGMSTKIGATASHHLRKIMNQFWPVSKFWYAMINKRAIFSDYLAQSASSLFRTWHALG